MTLDREALNRDGFVVLAEVLKPDEVSKLDALVVSYLKRRTQEGKAPPFLNFIDTEFAAQLIVTVAQRAHIYEVFGPSAYCYYNHIRLSRAGDRGAREFHRDYVAHPDRSLKVGIYLQDVDEISGSTEFVPGSHLGPGAESPAPITCFAGDGVLYHPNILHRRGPNASGADRRGIFLSFCGA